MHWVGQEEYESESRIGSWAKGGGESLTEKAALVPHGKQNLQDPFLRKIGEQVGPKG